MHLFEAVIVRKNKLTGLGNISRNVHFRSLLLNVLAVVTF